MKNTILTGDRPTGKLHIGHYVGSLRERVRLQNEGDYENFFVMIADAQALTDNADNPEKIRSSVREVMLDYLAVGLSPEKITFFIQSEVPALPELTMYYMNLVSYNRLKRNPTVKSELKSKEFGESVPVGFIRLVRQRILQRLRQILCRPVKTKSQCSSKPARLYARLTEFITRIL